MNHNLFDWDFENIRHITQHDVLPEEALMGITVDVSNDDDSPEERQSELGATKAGRILHVTTTMRRGRLRVVTAFEPNARIKRYYLVSRGR